MEYFDEQKKLDEVAEMFSNAFCSIENASIVKSQKNSFSSYVKFPLVIGLAVLLVVLMYVIQFAFSFFDAMYVICEVILTVGVAFAVVVLIRTWRRELANAVWTEKIQYYNGKSRLQVTEVANGGRKIEWNRGSLYIEADDFELIEGAGKEYKPYYYKKMHGHSRGYSVTDIDWLLSVYFNGASVVSNENGIVQLSTGFEFCIEYGMLKYFVINGFYHECYENNFPIMSFMSMSKRYAFRYEFSAINVPQYKLILPERTSVGAEIYNLELPNDENVLIR